MKKLLSESFSIFLIVLGILIIIGSVIVFQHHHAIDTKATVDGALLDQMGSFLAGAVGSLWALAGVVLFYVALKEQRKDIAINHATLELQKTELHLNTEELKGQRIEFEKQNETLTKQHETLTHQQFESTFFNLLKMLSDIRNNTEIATSRYDWTHSTAYTTTHKSHDFFLYLRNDLIKYYNEITEEYLKVFTKSSSYSQAEAKTFITTWGFEEIDDVLNIDLPSRCYYRLFNVYHNQLGHYFRSLFHMLKFIWWHELSELAVNSTRNRDRYSKRTIDENIHRKYKQYAEFIQAQMSSSELLLLFYNALFFPKMKRFVYHYDLIENLSKEDLLDPENDIKFYAGEKFDSYEYDAIELKSRKEILKP